MTAVQDFFKACNDQHTDVDGGMPLEYQFQKDLVRRVLYALINVDDEQAEFMCDQLRHSMQLAGSAETVALESNFVQHLSEYLKEQS